MTTLKTEMEDLARSVPAAALDQVEAHMESLKTRIGTLQTEDADFAYRVRVEIALKSHRAIVKSLEGGGRPPGVTADMDLEKLLANSQKIVAEAELEMASNTVPLDPERAVKIQMLKVVLRLLAKRHNELTEA